MQSNFHYGEKLPKSVVATRVVLARFNLSLALSAGFPSVPPSLLLGKGKRGASGVQVGGGPIAGVRLL